MRSDRRVLTIQDISCVGQCSLTVASPILSACGVETCVLPSAVLSNHTGEGFHGFTFRDLTEDIPGILRRWEEESIFFDGIYSGYLGSIRQIALVREAMKTRLRHGGIAIVDPAMADHGRLYRGFDMPFVRRMAELCGTADIILPNLTEACLMTGRDDPAEVQTERKVRELVEDLAQLGAGTVILKGISLEPGTLGNAVYDAKEETLRFCFTKKIARSSHGTGDCFAAVFTGAWMQGLDPYQAASLAADFVVESLLQTEGDPAHWYGVKFERALCMLTNRLQRGGLISDRAREAASGRRRYVLDGENFDDLEGFYTEISRIMTDESGGKVRSGHNLDGFCDVLRGGFGKHGYGEPIEVVWRNFERSREVLGDTMLLRIVSILLEKNGEHDCVLRTEA